MRSQLEVTEMLVGV